MNHQKIVHFSDKDLDGESCAILSRIAFSNQEVDSRGVTPYTVNQEVQKFIEEELTLDMYVVITDVSVNDEVALLIQKKIDQGHVLVLIDHHPTALPLASKYDWAKVIIEESGKKTSATSLYYDYLVNHGYLSPTGVLSHYVELVRSFDTWDWDATGTIQANQLNILFYMVERETFVQNVLGRLRGEGADTDQFVFDEVESILIYTEEKRIDEFEQKKLKQMKLIPVEIDLEEPKTYQVGVVFLEQYHSTTGNFLCKHAEMIDFVAMLDPGKGRISFRTIREDVDLSVIAQHYGGGGHPKASGCSFTGVTLKAYVYPALRTD
ncbi:MULTISPECIES: DHH family phosphoesterase [Brevibacillus]|uniref:DHH family phosphoesterase n=1 Tax=Brevibacillus TaxID=55080 RepID=UPI000D108AB4|nr:MULTISPECIES: DHHA1 domain-containing protein [Brevibacillus]PSJ68058.1 phosphohydrolase [Brevibacillus brevis]RED35533.1 oligoribonuclease NrnB/cAMP/cGMP phosphodiesterase (DHH superfamily) [Brevibacillus brevis]TQK63851.1 oligoribonuclease NrnB/cAMP/cGMP phosphodiesterase (DHH superfamily) [Brevibacillus sp. AG162]VEF89356.1 Oligoribonuclease nrnB [Brevibacillus brevis]GEC87799.1 oligoribonuclease NrnB [Brevibacillus brevis]